MCSHPSSYFASVWFEINSGKCMTYVMYKKPSSSLCSSYIEDIRAAVGGRTSSTKMKMAFSGESLILLRIT